MIGLLKVSHSEEPRICTPSTRNPPTRRMFNYFRALQCQRSVISGLGLPFIIFSLSAFGLKINHGTTFTFVTFSLGVGDNFMI